MKKLLILLFFTFFTISIQAAPAYQENFDSGTLGSEWRALKAEGGFIPDIVNGRLRLTDRSHDLSTALTLDYEFPTKDNNLTISFDYYSYGGCRDDDNYITNVMKAGKWGADGITIILFDSTAGATPRVGASGGSMGYANGNILMTDDEYQNQKGFEGGWLGIGLDEFGSYMANDENRHAFNGSTFSPIEFDDDEYPNTVAIRGDESKGYRLLFNKQLAKPLARPLVQKNGIWVGENLSYHSGRYELNIDSKDINHMYITLKRDGVKIIDRFDVQIPQQGPRPEKIRLAFSSGAGGGCNNHEIDNIEINGTANPYTPPSLSAGTPFTCDNNTSILFSSDVDEDISIPYVVDLAKGTVTEKNSIKKFGHFNAAGYNVKDNYIYAFSYKNKDIVKIDSNFKVVDRFIAKNLPTAAGKGNWGGPRYSGPVEIGYYLGDVATDGSDRYYIAKLDYSSGGKKVLQKIYEIDLNTKWATPITLKYKNGQQKITMADFAFNPIDNMLYVVNANDRSLYRMDILNAVAGEVDVEKVGPLGIGSVDIYSPITFFDNKGNLYIIVTKSGVTPDDIYKITDAKNSAKAIKINQTKLVSLSGDGARCAYAPMDDKPSLSIDPKTTILEGNSGDKTLLLSIKLSEAAKKDVTFDLQIIDSTATAGEDFVSTYTAKTTVKIPAGSLGVSIPVTIKGDTKPEHDETFKIEISNIKEASSAPIITAEGVIINDDFNSLTAYDTDTNLAFGEIKTKVVNKPFTLKLQAIQAAGTAALNADDMNNTMVKIVDSDDCSLPVSNLDKTGFAPFSILPGQNSTTHTFTVSKAMKNARVQFYWINEKGSQMSACSKDAFAVRPDHFTLSLTPKAPDTTLKAAKPFTIKIEAKDALGNTVTSYTGSNQAPYAVDYNDTKASSGCVVGTLTPNPINISFVNGVAIVNNAKYSEVGKIDFTVSDKKSSAYAVVDKNDHGITDSLLLIGKASASGMNFGVSKAIIEWELKNGDLLNGYTYFNDLNSSKPGADMGAILNIEATMKNNDDQVVKNFSNGCYAANVSLGINYTLESTDSNSYKLISEYQDANSIYHIGVSSLESAIAAPGGIFNALGLDALFFKDGIGVKRVKFNIDRKTDVAYDPMTFDITGLNAILGDADVSVTKKNSSQKIRFIYARAHIPAQSIAAKEAKVPVYYEVYCKNADLNDYGLQNLSESKDSIYWYILNNISSSLDYAPVTGAVSPFKPKDQITATHGLVTQRLDNKRLYMHIDKTPFVSTVEYKPRPYLVYNPFNALASTHKFTAKFTQAPKSWAGKGNTGLTVDTRVQERDNNVLEW